MIAPLSIAGKVIDIAGFGSVRIERDVAGNAGPERSFVAHVGGELPVWFTFTNRRVAVELVCDGLRTRAAALGLALQAALRYPTTPLGTTRSPDDPLRPPQPANHQSGRH